MTGCPRPLPAERRSRGSAPSPAPRRVYRFLLAAERPCELVRAFPTRLPGPRPLSLRQLRNCGAWITAAVSAEGHREAQCAGASVRDPRRAALGCSRSEFLGAETGSGLLSERVTRRLLCSHGSSALRGPGRHGQRGRAAAGLGAENHQGRLGLLCQVRGPPGLGRTWNPDYSPARDAALPSNATSAGRATGSYFGLAWAGEVAVLVEEFHIEGCWSPEDRPAPSDSWCSRGLLGVPARAVLPSRQPAGCKDGRPASSPSPYKNAHV